MIAGVYQELTKVKSLTFLFAALDLDKWVSTDNRCRDTTGG